MEWPMGIKQAKLIKKLEDSGVLLSVAPGLLTDLFNTRNAEEEKMMADMSSAAKELDPVLKAATSNKQDELRLRTQSGGNRICKAAHWRQKCCCLRRRRRRHWISAMLLFMMH
jgi:hypothetical protein